MLEKADRCTGCIRHVVARPAGVQYRPCLDPEELLILLLVGEEPDVLLDRHPLLPDERDRTTGRRLTRRERGDPVEIHDRPDELIDEVPVASEALVVHSASDRSPDR